ncbi:hypothetical protein ANN_13260 [Periplaneta americana]|uniref:Uncharacterized protein n=1 Tax=Periplaneta americana TaxID=6978 RepID=A0ABQ8TIX9_PERAM|nr:hypothetical protein ANN_13260 [Periplaneta americana]
MVKLNDDDNFIDELWMLDEAHLHLNGFVNKQNFRYWAPHNPRQLHQYPLYSNKVTMWGAVSSSGVMGPYFFEDDDGRAITVNSVRYFAMMETFVAHELQNFPQITWLQSLYRRPPEAAGSLDRPPWNVVKRRWMASATSTRGGPTRLPKQERYMDFYRL